MDDETLIDRIRALEEGRLPPETARELERRIAADPALAELRDAWRIVAEVRVPGLDDVAVPDLSARCAAEQLMARVNGSQDGAPPVAPLAAVQATPAAQSSTPHATRAALRRRAAPAPHIRRIHPAATAAAALLAVAAAYGAYAVLRGDGGSPPAPERAEVANATQETSAEPRDLPTGPVEVTLAAVPLTAPEIPDEEPLPPLLAAYGPVADGRPAWFESLGQARRVARAVGRPVLVFAMHPQCPMCIALEQDTLGSEEVLAAVADVVPVRLDVTRMDAEQGAAYFQSGWPYLVVEDAEGVRLANFSGADDAAQFRDGIAEGVRAAGAAGAAPAWERVRELASLLESAALAEDAERLGDAWTAYARLAEDGGDGPFGQSGRAGRARVTAWAHDALLEARELPAADAERHLADAAERLAGTPLGADLDNVLAALRTGRGFPHLLETAR